MKNKIDELLRDKILYIGNEIPDSLTADKRDKQIYLGYPEELVDQLTALFKKQEKEVICNIYKQVIGNGSATRETIINLLVVEYKKITGIDIPKQL